MADKTSGEKRDDLIEAASLLLYVLAFAALAAAIPLVVMLWQAVL